MRWIVSGLRTVLTAVVGIVVTIVCVVVVLMIVAFDKTSPRIERVIHFWSRAWLWASGTELRISGQDNIDISKSYVVVANHQSTLDIMACLLAVPLPIRFLAKKELFRIPVLAQGMRAVGIVEVDRAARGAIHAAVNRQARELIDAKRSLIIYAEGTRPRDGVMRPFKKGAFTMAIAAQLPVLPLTIHGSYEAFPPGQVWVHGGTIEVVVDSPIETIGLTPSDTAELRDEVYELISKRLVDLGGRVG